MASRDAIGCVGNLSAGVLGGPAIGFMQDHFASQDLRQNSPAAYERYKSDQENSFLFFHGRGLDSSKVAVLQDDGTQLNQDLAALAKSGRNDENLERLQLWWTTAQAEAEHDRAPVTRATIQGGRMALRNTAIIPVVMAVGFLILIVGFRSVGGYRAIRFDSDDAQIVRQISGVADDP